MTEETYNKAKELYEKKYKIEYDIGLLNKTRLLDKIIIRYSISCNVGVTKEIRDFLLTKLTEELNNINKEIESL